MKLHNVSKKAEAAFLAIPGMGRLSEAMYSANPCTFSRGRMVQESHQIRHVLLFSNSLGRSLQIATAPGGDEAEKGGFR